MHSSFQKLIFSARMMLIAGGSFLLLGVTSPPALAQNWMQGWGQGRDYNRPDSRQDNRDFNGQDNRQENGRRGGNGNRRGGGTPGEFDFYVLSLSWSPSFCEDKGNDRGSKQCEFGRKLGFVVHGLWPQYTRGYPKECSSVERSPTRSAIDKALKVFPEEGLARHEWRAHGTCSGLGPSEYFDAVAQARAMVKLPPEFEAGAPPSSIAPRDLEKAFIAANNGLRTDMMAITCKRRQLEEVRICFSRDLRRFESCAEVNRAGCRSSDVDLPPPH